jgi:hypothetical protein
MSRKMKSAKRMTVPSSARYSRQQNVCRLAKLRENAQAHDYCGGAGFLSLTKPGKYALFVLVTPTFNRR